MKSIVNPRHVFGLVVLAIPVATYACGSSDGDSTFHGAGAGQGQDGGGSGTLGDGASGGDGSSFMLPGADGATVQGTLAITPGSAVVSVTDLTKLPTQAFKATLTTSAGTSSVDPVWGVSDYSVASIDGTGTLTPRGTVAATIAVTASYGGLSATTNLTINVSITSQLGDVSLPDGTVIVQNASGISAPDQTALNGTPATATGSTVSPLTYPYDQTVFPRGLVAPVVQFTAGSVAPSDFKLSIDGTGFHWDGFGHVADPATLLAAIPQNVWDGALESATLGTTPANKLTLSLVTAANGVASGPSTTHLIVAPGKLSGIIYYESYSSDPLPDAGAGETDFGLWSVLPGSTSAPSHREPGCVLCHSVSASGNTLTASTDDQNGATTGSNTGVFRIESDGGMTQLATAPTALPYTENSARGLGWATTSPDGKIVMRSVNQYWGGDTLLAWAVPDEPLLANGQIQPLSTTVTVNGNLDMYVPEYSPDGKHLVYQTSANAGGATGTPSQSISMLDITAALNIGGTTVDASTYGSVTLTNVHTIYDATKAGLPDGGGGNVYTKVPMFLPDSQSIVYEETAQPSPVANNTLPDYVNNNETVYVDGELAMLQPNGTGGYQRVALANANKGNDPNAATHNYEPKPLPVQVGGYYWVVFASTRSDAYPGLQYPKKLWVAAITPGGGGIDTSHPAFTLVNQAIVHQQHSQRAYWSLAPCQGLGVSCENADDCCNGSCVPAGDASAALVCGAPPVTTCVATGGRCQAGQDSQCCNAAQGTTCIGTLNGFGTCAAPTIR